MTEKPKLEHKFHCVDGHWYWVCPICGEWLCPHRMDIHSESWRVLQSKGAASRHLMMHDSTLVQHGRKIQNILKKPKIYKNCKECGRELDEYQVYGLCSECLSNSVKNLIEQNRPKKLFTEKRKILVDKIGYGTNVECFCGKTYYSNRYLKNGDISSCCYCYRHGFYKDGKLSVYSLINNYLYIL